MPRLTEPDPSPPAPLNGILQSDNRRDLTERLQESEEMFRQLTEVNDQVFYLLSLDFKVMHYVSPSYEKVWDRTCESLYKNPLSWIDAVHPQDREHVWKEMGTHLGGRFEIQYRIVRKDGTVRWILARHGEIKDKTGVVQRLCGTALDITDLKLARRDVVKCEMRYRRLFEAAKDGILILDADTGAIDEINPFMLQLLGCSAKECYGKKLWDIGFFSDEDLSKNLLEELQATGYVRYEDMPLKTKAGLAVAVEFISTVYSVGGVAVIQCIIRDITARKRTEEGLRRLARIIECSDEGIIGVSLDGVIESWNPACERLFGYRPDEIIGRHVSTLCTPDLHEGQKRLMESVIGGKNIQQFGTIRLGKDGRPIGVSLSLSQIVDQEGRMVGFSGFYRDITKSLHLEAKLRQSQKMEGIGRLAGGIAHDFNNLLTGIMGYSGFLLESLPAEDPNRGDVVEIVRAAERAAALTRQLLAFSRQQVLTVKVLDVNVAITDLEKMLRRIINESITLTFRPGVELGHVKAAPGQIEQILMNLCVNAKDAMEDGGELLIETSNVAPREDDPRPYAGGKAGPSVLLAISDTGCGMSAHVLAHIFEPFFTTKEQGKGTGLGLSTVYGIVEQNGGSIEVDSVVGRGTTINIYLPRCDGPVTPPREAPAVRAIPRGREVVLVVEDDESVGRFVGRVLKEQGYSVLSARSPSEALRMCEEDAESIKLLLTDIVMPEMLGYELSRRVTAIKPGLKIVFMSGYSEPSIVDRAALHGAAFLQKPMSAQDIATAVRTALDGPPPGAMS